MVLRSVIPRAISDSFTNISTIGPKTPGLIILEHEISDQSVQAFIDGYPIAKANGWNTMSLAALVGGGNVYQNAANSSSPVSPAAIVAGQNPPSPSSSSSQPPPPSSSQSSQSSHTESVFTIPCLLEPLISSTLTVLNHPQGQVVV